MLARTNERIAAAQQRFAEQLSELDQQHQQFERQRQQQAQAQQRRFAEFEAAQQQRQQIAEQLRQSEQQRFATIEAGRFARPQASPSRSLFIEELQTLRERMVKDDLLKNNPELRRNVPRGVPGIGQELVGRRAPVLPCFETMVRPDGRLRLSAGR